MMHQTAAGPDKLTGLPGHDAFLAAFEGCISQAEKAGGAVSMALVDIDMFAELNARHGRDAGDATLKALAGFLQSTFAAMGTVFRYGGDAFAVLLDGAEKEQAFLLVERARSDFEGEHEVEMDNCKTVISTTITIGVASFPDDGAQPQDIVRRANEAVYRAKTSGSNRVCLAREEKMVTKTSHYTQGQLHGLSRLAKREGVGEAVLLREALDDLLRKCNS